MNIKQHLHHSVMKSFLYGLPIYILISVVMRFIDSSFFNSKDFKEFNFYLGYIFVFFIFVWLFSVIYFFIALILNSETREEYLKKIFKYQERDEREEAVVAEAAKKTFILSAGVLIVFFVVSTCRLGLTEKISNSVTPVANEKISNPKAKDFFIIGVLDFYPQKLKENILVVNAETSHLNTYDFPTSKTGLILIMLLIQFLSFKYFIRKKI